MASEQRFKTERILIFAVGALILLLTALYFVLQRADHVSPQFLASSLLLYALAMLNVVLVLVLLFVMFRTLIKVLVERRRGVLGARFQAKMVFTFVAMTLLPSMVVFAAALYLIQLSVERWFSTPVDQITSISRDMVDAYYDSVRGRSQIFAQDLARDIRRERMMDLDQRARLQRSMRSALRTRHLDLVQVATRDGELVTVVDPRLSVEEVGATPQDSLDRALRGEPFWWMERLDDGFLVRGGAPVRSSFNDDVVSVVVVGLIVPGDLMDMTEQLVAANANYRQLKARRVPVKRVYEFTFTLVGLLIVFAAVWVGLFLARGYTAPVQALAEGTKEIAAGNLDHVIEVEARDEMGSLVSSFNQMTAELKHGREVIERSNLELQRSNQELEERRRYVEVLLESISTGVLSLDRTGRVSTMNRAAYRVLRLEGAGDLTGIPYSELFTREGFEPLRELLDQARQARGVQVSREFHFGAGGRNFSLAVTLSSLEDPRRGLVGMLMVLEDLTHLIRAQKIAAWREVARRMAHEIKNPLTPIQLSAQRIAKKFREGSPDLAHVVEQGTETIVNEVNTLKMLVNEFSRYARMPEVQPRATDLHAVIEEAISVYESVHGDVAFHRQFDPRLPEVPLDRQQMKRAFVNLLENALEATGRKGEIHVETEYLDALGLVRVEVSDDGPGIRPEDRDKLFLPYFSTKKRGTGLGLAIVNRIVSDHHGGIRVEDNLPHGARFVIDLPAEAA